MEKIFCTNLKSAFVTHGTLSPGNSAIVLSNPLQIINYAEQVPLTTALPSNSNISAICFSNDNRYLAYATEAIAIYDFESKKERRVLSGHTKPVTSIAAHHKTPYIWGSASCEDGVVSVWDIRQHPACQFSKKISKTINSLQFSPDDSLLACGGDQLILLNTTTFHPSLTFPTNIASQILSVHFNPYEYVLVTSSIDKVIRCWDIETTECVSQSIPFETPLRGVQFDESGQYIIAATDKSVTLLNMEPCDIINQHFICLPNEMTMAQTLDFKMLPEDPNEILILSWDERRNVHIKRLFISSLFQAQKVPCLDEQHSTTVSSPDIERDLLSPSVLSSSSNELLKESLSMSDLIKSPTTSSTTSPSPRSSRLGIPIKINKRQPSPEGLTKLKAACSTSKLRAPPTYPKNTKNIIVNKINPSPKEIRSRSISNTCLKRDSISSPSPTTSPQIQARSSPRIKTPTTPKSLIMNRSSSTTNTRVPEPQSPHGTRIPVNKPPIMPPHPEPPSTFPSIYIKIQNMQAKCDAENKVILNELDTVISSIKNGGIKKVLSQRMVFSKGNSMGIVFKELLNIDALWSMHLVELAIPHLNNLLTSKNRETVDVGLEMLELIVNEYVPIIKENLSCPIEYSYRVDISAEERKERCMTCQQRLTQLMFNASFLKERMSKEQQGYFQEIVDKSGLI